MKSFVSLKKKIDQWIDQEPLFSQSIELAQVMHYSLQKGKRFRPALILLIAKYLEIDFICLKYPCLAVEYFHSASLIADDLPMMDDSVCRRGQQTSHLKFTESKALLASFALIALGYQRLAETPSTPSRIRLATHIASTTTGIDGICGGQFLDLYPSKKSSMDEMIAKKTGALFEVSFCFAWIFSNQEISLLPIVKDVAHRFGFAFQLADDLMDFSDQEKEKNYACVFGKDKAKERLDQELHALENGLKELHLSSLKGKELIEYFFQQEGTKPAFITA